MKLFIGRPDGIGNRIEEVIRLCDMYPKDKIIYVWNNIAAIPSRSYPVCITHPRVTFMVAPSLDRFGPSLSKFGRYFFMRLYNILKPRISYDQAAKTSATLVKPNFNIRLPEVPTLGLHLRGGDRIDLKFGDSEHFMRSRDELFEIINKALDYIKGVDVDNILICADEADLREYALNSLQAMGKRVVLPDVDDVASKDFIDFFSLSHCNQIVIATKFSSFSLTAALVGDIPVKHFGTPENLIRRYGVRVILDK